MLQQNTQKNISADILFLTDYCIEAGGGHVSRCAAIAAALNKLGLTTIFATGHAGAIKLLRNFQYFFYDWYHSPEHLQLHQYKLVFIDSYIAGYDIKKYVYEQSKNVAFYDDGFCLDLPGGYVFNGLAYAERLNYKNKYARYFLGVRYLPVRREFVGVIKKTINPGIQTVFICLGRTDLNRVLADIVQQINKIFKDIRIILIGETDKMISDENVSTYSDISAKEVKDLMGKADIAIGNGGQISSELGKLGIPSILYSTAQNQDMNVEYLVEKNAVLYGGSYQDSTKFFFKNLSKIKDICIRQQLSNNYYELYRHNGAANIAKVTYGLCR